MSIRKIHLRKLLKAFNEPENKKISLLKNDIRNERKKLDGKSTGGGDFYGPFWSDAKNHTSGKIDLSIATLDRIAKNEHRGRLYPRLCNGFLEWWHKKRRSRNEQIFAFPYTVKKQHELSDLKAIVKVENLLSILIGDGKDEPQGKRLIYPYFSEEPILDGQSARLGLWLLCEAFPEHNPADLRILDVMRAKSFSILDYPLIGTEEKEFKYKYKNLIDKWDELNQKYG